MAKPFLTSIDLQKNELQNAALQNLAVAPSSPAEGQIYYDTALDRPRVWNGAAWQDMVGADGTVTGVSGAAPITSTGGTSPEIGITAATPAAAGSMSAADKTKLDGVAPAATANSTDADLLSRANHTGSQAISTVTGLQTALNDKAAAADLTAHTGNTANPHAVTKTQVGLGNVPNVDATDRASHTGAQAISTVTALQAALDGKIAASLIGQANGVASLDGGGKVPAGQLPALAISEFLGSVGSQAAMLALTGERGDWAIRTDTNTTWILTADDASVLGNWQQIATPTDGVSAVTGAAPITSTGGSAPEIGLAAGGVLTAHVGDDQITSAKLAAAVRADIAASTRKFAAAIGDGAATSFTVTHNLGSRDVTAQVYLNSGTYEEVIVDVEHTTTTTVTVRFGVAPTSGQYRVVIVG